MRVRKTLINAKRSIKRKLERGKKLITENVRLKGGQQHAKYLRLRSTNESISSEKGNALSVESQHQCNLLGNEKEDQKANVQKEKGR